MSERQERAAETRRLILEAAAEEFRTYGFSGARLSRIVAATGMTKGAVYFHFTSKQQIADTLLAGKYLQWPPLVAEVRSAGGHGLDGMRMLVSSAILRMATDPLVRAAMRLSQELRLASQSANPYRSWAERLEPFLEEAVADGGVSPELDRSRAAQTIVNGVFGVLQVALDVGAVDAIPDELEAFWALIEPGLRAGTATS